MILLLQGSAVMSGNILISPRPVKRRGGPARSGRGIQMDAFKTGMLYIILFGQNRRRIQEVRMRTLRNRLTIALIVALATVVRRSAPSRLRHLSRPSFRPRRRSIASSSAGTGATRPAASSASPSTASPSSSRPTAWPISSTGSGSAGHGLRIRLRRQAVHGGGHRPALSGRQDLARRSRPQARARGPRFRHAHPHPPPPQSHERPEEPMAPDGAFGTPDGTRRPHRRRDPGARRPDEGAELQARR